MPTPTSLRQTDPCCCRWGAATRDEYPEFACWHCPRHGAEPGLVDPGETCSRHSMLQPVVNMEALRQLLPGPTPDEITEAIASIRKDAP